MRDGKNPPYWKVPKDNGEYEKVPLQGFITFENVHFGYEPGQRVLNNINLYAKPGQKIAFVGSTGAGNHHNKSHQQVYEIDEGTIFFDGIDIRRIKT